MLFVFPDDDFGSGVVDAECSGCLADACPILEYFSE